MGTRALIAVLSGIIAVLVVALIVVIAAGGDDNPLPAAAASAKATSAAPSPSLSPSPSPQPQPWETGRCLNGGATAGVSSFTGGTVVPCDSAQAKSKIIALVADAALKCPAQTDGFAQNSGQDTACVRNLAAPHPGDPGKGGGVLRTGDCVYIAEPSDTEDTDPQERPCYDRYGPGRIWGFYKKKSQCKRPDGFLDNHYTNRRDHPATPVICTTEGYDVEEPGPQYAKGVCIRKPVGAKSAFPNSLNIFGGVDKVGCGSSKAWAKVVGSVSEKHCPRGTAYELIDTDFYPGTTCLRRV